GRQAGGGGGVGKYGRPSGHSWLCRPHWLTRRERQKTPGERVSPFRQWSSSARHGAIGVAISNVPEGERLSAVVSSSHGERSRCSQAHDRGLGTQATDRSVAVWVAGRCPGRRRFAFGTMIGGGGGDPRGFAPLRTLVVWNP